MHRGGHVTLNDEAEQIRAIYQLDFQLTGGEVSDSTRLTMSLAVGRDMTPRIAMIDKAMEPE